MNAVAARAAEEDQQHDVADANDEGDGTSVDADDPLDETFDGVEEEAHDSRLLRSRREEEWRPERARA